MKTREFMTAWELSPTAPCDGCTSRAQCGERKLACDAFRLYVEYGRRLSPCSVIGYGHRGKPEVVGFSARPMPTREIFDRLKEA
jgi:hypothetical protein